MFIRKVITSAFILCGFTSSFIASAGSDGVIKFTGKISASACTVDSVNGAGNYQGVVDLGTISTKTLATVGSQSNAVPFTIELKDCAVTAAPKITFNGAAVSVSGSEVFASNIDEVGINIADADKTSTIYRPGISTQNTGFDKLLSSTEEDPITTATGNFTANLVRASVVNSSIEGEIDTDILFTVDYSAS